jgi:toxin ParE1/3/4
MSRFRLTPLADEDLTEIVVRISQDSPRAAARVFKELKDACRMLAKNPGFGHRREDLTDRDLRFWSVYSYLVVYDPAMKPLVVVGFLHASRDVAAILRRRS